MERYLSGMTYRTIQVEIEDGEIRAAEGEVLPRRGRGVLTVLEGEVAGQKKTTEELAAWWENRTRLPDAEAEAFAADIEAARKTIPPLRSSWE